MCYAVRQSIFLVFREEFTQGCVSLQSDSIQSVKGSFHTLEVEAERDFKDLYKFTFQFGLDVEQVSALWIFVILSENLFA